MQDNNSKCAFCVALLLSLTACKSTEPEALGLQDGKLAQCPPKPNCVLSEGADEEHKIAPLEFNGTLEEAKAALKQIAANYADETAEVITEDGNYMHMEFMTPLMRYVDDVEFLIEPGELIHVRSASRVGHGDLGANRERVENIRAKLSKPAQDQE